MVPICPGWPLRQLLLLLSAVSVLQSQELPSKDVEALLARLAESRSGSGMQANFLEERRLALMEKPVVETGTVSFLPPDMIRRAQSISAMTSGFGLQELAKNYRVEAWQSADGYAIKLYPKTSSLRRAVSEIQVDISNQLYAKRVEI